MTSVAEVLPDIVKDLVAVSSIDWAAELVHATLADLASSPCCPASLDKSMIAALAKWSTANGYLVASATCNKNENHPDLPAVLGDLRRYLPHRHSAIRTLIRARTRFPIATLCASSELKDKFLGVTLLEACIDAGYDNGGLSDTLTGDVVDVLAHSASNRKAALHDVAQRVLSSLKTNITSSSMAYEVISLLTASFDSRSRSGTCSALAARLDVADYKRYVDSLVAAGAIESIYATVRQPSIQDDCLEYAIETLLTLQDNDDRVAHQRLLTTLQHLPIDLDRHHRIAMRIARSNQALTKLVEAGRLCQGRGTVQAGQALARLAYAIGIHAGADIDSVVSDLITTCERYAAEDHVDDDKFISVLVDILIAISATPSAFLHKAVLGVARAFASQICAQKQHLADIVSAIAPNPDTDQDVDVDDDDDMSEDDDADEDDADDDDDDDDDDEPKQMSDDGSDGDEDGDSDNGEDEEGADSDEDKYESALASYVRARCDAKRAASAAVTAAMHFRCRLIDLLEQVVRVCSRSPVLVSLIGDLHAYLRTFQARGPGAAPVVSHLASLLTKRICAARPLGLAEDAAHDLVTGAIRRAGSARDALSLACARAELQHALRACRTACATHPGCWAADRVAEFLQAYIHRQHRNINAKFFIDLIERHADLAAPLLRCLAAAAPTAVNDFLQAQCGALLGVLLRKHGKDAAVRQVLHDDADLVRGVLLQALQTTSAKAQRVRMAFDTAFSILKTIDEGDRPVYLSSEVRQAVQSVQERHPQVYRRMRMSFQALADMMDKTPIAFESTPPTKKKKKKSKQSAQVADATDTATDSANGGGPAAVEAVDPDRKDEKPAKKKKNRKSPNGAGAADTKEVGRDPATVDPIQVDQGDGTSASKKSRRKKATKAADALLTHDDGNGTTTVGEPMGNAPAGVDKDIEGGRGRTDAMAVQAHDQGNRKRSKKKNKISSQTSADGADAKVSADGDDTVASASATKKRRR